VIRSNDGGFFRIENGQMIANDAARGPWSADACHAGPVAGILARALEQALPHKQLVRLSLDFHRSIPMTALDIETHIEREGRGTAVARATLSSASGVCVTATSLYIASLPLADLPTVKQATPNFADAEAGNFAMQQAPHGLPFFTHGTEVAFPPGETPDPGPTMMWMRTLPIVAGEAPSPFQSVCPLADCGNAISRNAEFTTANFINPDLTIAVFRLPESDWLASRARSNWEPNGIGLAQAQLFDTQGEIGVALQSLIVRLNQK
jgi:hypothetical protein